LAPYHSTIAELLAETPEIKSPAVLERLRKLGFKGGVTIVRDHLMRTRPRSRREAFLTLDFEPGAVMQVDWADAGYLLPGCPRRVSALVMVLCYSRYLYLEFTLSQAFGTFIRAMERGVRFFGGTTHADVFDNMKTVVQSHTPVATVFNPQFLAYARSRGFAVRACTPGRAHEKGRVERPIGFVRSRFLAGRRFSSLLELNQRAAEWRDDFANNRVHESTGKIPALVYRHEEHPKLKPLGALAFDTDDLLTTRVTKLFRVTFDRNTYSVPPRLLGQTVLVRADDSTVRVVLGDKDVASHNRVWDIGKDIEDRAHRLAALESKPRPASALPPQLASLGQLGADYFRIFAATHRSVHKEIERLTFLCEIFGARPAAEALDEVMRTGHVGAEYVEYILRHRKGITPQPKPIVLGDPELDGIHFNDPDLSIYDDLVPPWMTRDPRGAGDTHTKSDEDNDPDPEPVT
jgi:transposase